MIVLLTGQHEISVRVQQWSYNTRS